MRDVPTALYRADQVRELDRRAIEEHGIPGFVLMTRAGEAALGAMRAHWPEANHLAVLCGAGNNAGDAYVLARLAAEAGYRVSVLALVDPEKLTGDAKTAFEAFVAGGGTPMPWAGAIPESADLIIDGLLGTGLDRPLTGSFAACVEAANRAPAPVFALDIPTGLHADSGGVLGCAMRAGLTVTFIGLKVGLYTGEGPALTGPLVYDELGVPGEVFADLPPVARRLDRSLIGRLLPPRLRTAHKGDFGHLILVGGGPGMPGAIMLAGEAALRTGAGRVTVATLPAHLTAVVARRPELMCAGVDSPSDLAQLLKSASCIGVGPGIGQTEWARAMLRQALESGLDAVLDADALNLLAAAPARRDNWILTPHPGEAARLLGCTTREVQTDRLGAAARLAAGFAGVAVLKGAGSVVSREGEIPWVCDRGNPGMAAPGMGDVLTGIIAALVAQGMDLWDAARAGVLIHACAGDDAARNGERGLLARDLIREIRSWVNP